MNNCNLICAKFNTRVHIYEQVCSKCPREPYTSTFAYFGHKKFAFAFCLFVLSLIRSLENKLASFQRGRCQRCLQNLRAFTLDNVGTLTRASLKTLLNS